MYSFQVVLGWFPGKQTLGRFVDRTLIRKDFLDLTKEERKQDWVDRKS